MGTHGQGGGAIGKHLEGLTRFHDPDPACMRRSVLALLGVLALAGCAGQARQAPRHPDALIVAFADGFHSGVMVERSRLPAWLAPDARVAPGDSWAVLHFGERRWIRGEADGVIDALRLAVWPGEGGMQVDVVPWWIHTRGGTDPSGERIWLFPVSQAELDGLFARVDAWVPPGSTCQRLTESTWWWTASRRWALWDNCHDFTADLLRGADIPIGREPIWQAGGMREALDEAWAERDPGP